jgi:regulator of sigma E protease
MVARTMGGIAMIFSSPSNLGQLSGPVAIIQASGDAAKAGWDRLLNFAVLISVALMVFNLLPIPILDGGHLTIIALESTLRRDLSLKVKERILEVGFYLLIILMVIVLFNDIVKTLPESVYRFFFRSGTP